MKILSNLAALVLALIVGVVHATAEPQSDTTSTPLSPREEIIRQFKSLDFYYTGGQYHDEKFSYRLYVPSQLEPGMKYPLIVWLHGLGEKGGDNRKHLVHIDTVLALYLRKHHAVPVFVLAPQVPKNANWFRNSKAAGDDMLTVTWSMLQRIIQEYPIDEDRIVVAGVSLGGTACWEMGMRHPGQFAAISAIASNGGDASRAAKLIGTPIWAFNNIYDEQAPVELTRKTVRAVRSAGGLAKLTEIPNIGHAAWIQALYNNCKLIEWLLDRRRGESTWNCYFQFVNWQKIALQCGLPVAVAAAALIWLWRRRLSVARCAQNIPVASDLDRELSNLASYIGEKL